MSYNSQYNGETISIISRWNVFLTGTFKCFDMEKHTFCLTNVRANICSDQKTKLDIVKFNLFDDVKTVRVYKKSTNSRNGIVRKFYEELSPLQFHNRICNCEYKPPLNYLPLYYKRAKRPLAKCVDCGVDFANDLHLNTNFDIFCRCTAHVEHYSSNDLIDNGEDYDFEKANAEFQRLCSISPKTPVPAMADNNDSGITMGDEQEEQEEEEEGDKKDDENDKKDEDAAMKAKEGAKKDEEDAKKDEEIENGDDEAAAQLVDYSQNSGNPLYNKEVSFFDMTGSDRDNAQIRNYDWRLWNRETFGIIDGFKRPLNRNGYRVKSFNRVVNYNGRGNYSPFHCNRNTRHYRYSYDNVELLMGKKDENHENSQRYVEDDEHDKENRLPGNISSGNISLENRLTASDTSKGAIPKSSRYLNPIL